jgi:hypothetical protein
MYVNARGVKTLAGFKPSNAAINLSKWGGSMSRRYQSTGYFHTKHIDGRYRLIDPEGYLCYHAGVAAVAINESPLTEKNAVSKFGSVDAWADSASKRLKEIGFNAAGAWSYEAALTKTPLGICGMSYFVTTYAENSGIAENSAGHKTFSQNNAIPVFDPAFEAFSNEYAENVTRDFKDSPNIVGWFSDNELPANYNVLDRFLTLNAGLEFNKYSLAVAWEFLKRETNLPNPTLDNITEDMYLKFRGVVFNRYFRVVSTALKAADPNHMYLGCRFMYLGKRFVEGTLLCESMMRAAGHWCDIISINYYLAWTPDSKAIQNFYNWSGKPFILTEWYAMAKDSGLECSTGAGFRVATQQDRGVFYQNFALWLLECPSCVGFHWFKYMDNDPSFKEAEASNINGNKGMFTPEFKEWKELTGMMQELNEQIYPLIEYFDRKNSIK